MPEINLVLGYVFSIGVGALFIKPFHTRVWKFLVLYDRGKDKTENNELQVWTSQLVGVIERFIYTSAILFVRSELIAVWMGIKAISQWKRWEDRSHVARATFALFLVGTGLSLAYGILGAQITLWLNDGICSLPIISAVGLILLNSVFTAITANEIKKKTAENK